MRDLAYLKLMSREYPTIKAASSEIINLTAIQGLPKGTEYFFSDLHGEYEAFIHLLRSASGIIREKITETFGHIIPEKEEVELANMICYPERVVSQMQLKGLATDDWQRVAIYRLVQICKVVSSKYTRSKVRKALPSDFAYIIDELLHTNYDARNKEQYYNKIIDTIVDIYRADAFIIALATAMLLLSFLPGVSEFGHGTHVCRDLCRRRETVGLHRHPQMAVPVERHAAESPAAGLVQDNGPCQLLGIGQPLGIGRLPEPNPLIGCDRLDPLQVVV